MTTEEFYQKYANLPLNKRFKIMGAIHYGDLTLAGLYNQIKMLDDKIRPLKIEQRRILEIADRVLPQSNKGEK